MMKTNKKTSIQDLSNQTLLVILDGYGINSNNNKNAVKNAKTPTIDKLFKNYPYTTIEPGGEAVGLPSGIAGNSEVGHMNIGAGSPVRQDLVRINESIQQDTLKDLPLFKNLIKITASTSKRIHIMGLLSDGGVHSHIDHIQYILNTLGKENDLQIYFHAFSDGRDTPRDSASNYISQLEKACSNFTFASIGGRSFIMDRDQRWEKVKRAYDTLTSGENITNLSPLEYVANEYKNDRYDEFLTPVLFSKKSMIKNDDSVFFINFRPDRAAEITLAMTDPNFSHFKRNIKPNYFLCMTPYIQDEIDLPILFNKEVLTGGLSEYLSLNNFKQYKIAETEKYAHITYFFNGGRKKPFPKEEQVLVPSSKDVNSYDELPEMSAPTITTKLLSALDQKDISFYLVNYANSDMVGHTGNYHAAIQAVETLDKCVDQLLSICLKNNITLIITADHGNSDEMVYDNGKVHTSHTKAKVPFCVINSQINNHFSLNGTDFALKDVAPTILYTLGIQQPRTFQGTNIFK